jgi:adenylate cyclase
VTSSSTPYLLLKTEAGERHLSLLGSHCWTIGRGDDNNFVLPDRWISRHHALLQCIEDGNFYLIDLGSRNGTFVNGRRVSVPVTLQDGDALTFGQTELGFFCPGNGGTVSGTNARADFHQPQDVTATATLHVRRLISVMVADIRDFTVLTRQTDEKVLSEAIGTWFKRAGEIISEYGSWVDKYIGDAVMAVWVHGAEGATPEEMMRMMRAVNTLAEMTSQLHKQFPLPFPLRIGAGVNTGYAMVGNTGTGDRPDYTAIGDTVNAAFRFESSTKELGLDIAIGETTYDGLQTVGPDEAFFHRYTVTMKGYEIPIMTHGATFADLQRFLRESSPLV